MDGYLGFVEFFVVALSRWLGSSLNWWDDGWTGKRQPSSQNGRRRRSDLPEGTRHPERKHRLHHRKLEPIE